MHFLPSEPFFLPLPLNLERADYEAKLHPKVSCVVVDMNIYTHVNEAKGAYMCCQLFENP